MDLNCPKCGTAHEVPGVLIPGARVTTSCSQCGARFGGTVPARADQGKREVPSKKAGRVRRETREKSRDGREARAHGSSHGHAPDRREAWENRSREVGVKRADSGRSLSEKESRSGGPRGDTSGAGSSRREKPRRRQSDESRQGRTPLRVVAKGLNPERLAKLVASDMLLYNREKVERTSEQGNLLSSMAPEIVEAWEFYKGRVGDETAKGTSHFRDAINSVLGGEAPVI